MKGIVGHPFVASETTRLVRRGKRSAWRERDSDPKLMSQAQLAHADALHRGYQMFEALLRRGGVR